MIAALYVETDGAYFGLPGVEPWDEAKDARNYTGPLPVVAHPPCQRWGRYWHGAPNKPNEYRLGEDGGCFAAALTAVRNYGGVLEHPAHSNAWRYFGLTTPPKGGGWVEADEFGGWTCHVEQGHYGHMSRKQTWLYAVGTERPELKWGSSGQRIHPTALARYGYEKARRIGMMAMVGGKDKTRIRNATPPEFRDLLLAIARSANKASNVELRGDPPVLSEERPSSNAGFGGTRAVFGSWRKIARAGCLTCGCKVAGGHYAGCPALTWATKTTPAIYYIVE